MATNFHSELSNDQLHDPKDFSVARKRSITTKSAAGKLEWVKANYTTSFQITAEADVEGSKHHTYFTLYSSNDANKYAVYLKITADVSLVTPSGYTGTIACDVSAAGNGATAAQIGDAIQVAVDAHADFTATDNNAGFVTITGMTSSTVPDAGNTGFSVVITDTEVVNEVLTTDSSGDMKWVSKSSFSTEIEDVEGTEIKSTGETGGTKFLREDGDGTCSWQTISAGSGDIESVQISADTGTKIYASGAAEYTIAGGTNITTSISEDTITISETTEKKTKSDIDTLTGTTETNLGTFDGGTIADSRDIKGALQDLETKVEADATTSVKGRASFNAYQFDVTSGAVSAKEATTSVKGIASFASSDFSVTSGAVSISKRHSTISETYRFETYNLAPTAGNYYGWNNEQHNKSGKIETAISEDMADLTTNYGLWSTVYIRPELEGTYTFGRMTTIMSGSTEVEVQIKLWKFSPDSETANYGNGTLLSTCTTSLSGNENPKMTTGSNESEGLTLAAKDVIVFTLEVTENAEDLDCRGAFSFEIDKVV